jgi:hypothetical protein
VPRPRRAAKFRLGRGRYRLHASGKHALAPVIWLFKLQTQQYTTIMGLPAWLQQLLGPYLKVLAPIARQIGPEFHQIMRAILVALDRVAKPIAPVLHMMVDAVSPQLLVSCYCFACNIDHIWLACPSIFCSNSCCKVHLERLIPAWQDLHRLVVWLSAQWHMPPYARIIHACKQFRVVSFESAGLSSSRGCAPQPLQALADSAASSWRHIAAGYCSTGAKQIAAAACHCRQQQQMQEAECVYVMACVQTLAAL